jgi:hypothetical protein
MWNSTIKKLMQLKEMDTQCLSFGAEEHRYQLLPCVSDEEIERIEKELEIVLPIELRDFYSNVGNGIVGPFYGLVQIQQIKGYRQNELYPGINALKQNAKILDADYLNYMGEGYFELYHENLTGLIPIIHEGCGHEICLITAGNNVGKVVYLSANGHLKETNKSLIDIYDEWINQEIILLEVAKPL